MMEREIHRKREKERERERRKGGQRTVRCVRVQVCLSKVI